jgi:hypothetical protein
MEVERLRTAALAQDQDVRVPGRGKEGGLRSSSSDDRIDGVCRAVDKKVAATKKFRVRQPAILRRYGRSVQQALHRIVRHGSHLIHFDAAVVVFDDQISEGTPGIARKSHCITVLKGLLIEGSIFGWWVSTLLDLEN